MEVREDHDDDDDARVRVCFFLIIGCILYIRPAHTHYCFSSVQSSPSRGNGRDPSEGRRKGSLGTTPPPDLTNPHDL